MYITGVVKEKDLEGTIIKEHFFFFSPQLLSTLGEIGYYFHLDEMLALL